MCVCDIYIYIDICIYINYTAITCNYSIIPLKQKTQFWLILVAFQTPPGGSSGSVVVGQCNRVTLGELCNAFGARCRLLGLWKPTSVASTSGSSNLASRRARFCLGLW